MMILIITILIVYPAALYFGNGADLITLNFRVWTGHDFSDGGKSIFVIILSTLVMALPPIYVMATIPIKAITLSANAR